MRRYRLYGLTLGSGLELSHHVPEAGPGAHPDLTFELADAGATLPGEGSGAAEVVYRSPERLPDGESVLVARRSGAIALLTWGGEASFAVSADRIVGRPEPGAGFRPGRTRAEGLALLEVRLLGPVLAFWLERAGLAALHASAVVVDGRAAVFLSGNGGGKTSLAASLLAPGRPLLTDDVLAVEAVPGGFLGRPSYPQMRMWPDDAARFVGTGTHLGRAHPGVAKLRVPMGSAGLGTFDSEPRPLGRIYLPERREGAGSVIDPLPGREAVMALVRYSVLPRLAEAMGWGPRRLELFGGLVSGVELRRLVYPSGHGHLRGVRDAILDDLER